MANGSATYCLLCAKLKTLAEVIDVENKIDELINKLTRINATAYLRSVNLPKKVCLKCITFLEGAYEFVLEVERAQHALLDLKPDLKQEICAYFEATEIVLKVEQEIETIDVDKNPLLNEVDSPASSIEAAADTSISNLTDEIKNETVKLNTKQTCKKKIFGDDKNPLYYEENPPAPSIEAPVLDTSSSRSTDEKENETIKLRKITFQSPPINPLSSWEDYIWKCGICDTELPTQEELKTHAMEFHKCCNAQKCYDCNIRKGILDQFNKHVHQKHRKQLRCSCYKCFKTFPSLFLAGIHRQTHRPTPHYCKGCNTTFETKNQLKDHMSTYYRLKIQTTIKSNYICETCGKCFINMWAHNAHMRVHRESIKLDTKQKCKKKNFGVDNTPLHYEEDPPAPSIETPADTVTSNSADEVETEIVKINTKRKCKRKNFGVDNTPLHYEEEPPAPSIEAPADTSISNSTDEKENETVKINTKPKRKKKIVGGDKNPLHYEEEPPAPSIEAPADTSISNSTYEKENETVKLNTKPERKEKIIGDDKNPLQYTEDPPAPSIETPAVTNSTDEKENETMKLNQKQKSKKRTFKLVKNASSTWKDYIWKCGICDTEFPTHEELKTHAMEFHKCCNVQKCYDCNIRKGKLDQFNKHVQQKHRKPLSFSCYKCFKAFPTPCKAGIHRHTHRPTPHYCKGCNTTFETENELKDHMSTYYSLKIRIMSKSDHICETCGKSFLNKWALKNHMRVHTVERPFPCTICTQTFKNKYFLSAHLNLHKAENQYICDVCNRSYKTKVYLKRHLIVHTNLLPHVCCYCSKGFRFKTLLNIHLRQHTGDKPYTCNICDWKFTNWANWNKHMKRRHNMNMSKRKPIHTSEETSESMKK